MLVSKMFSTAADPLSTTAVTGTRYTTPQHTTSTTAATYKTLTGTLAVYFLYYIPSDLLFVSSNGTCCELSFE